MTPVSTSPAPSMSAMRPLRDLMDLSGRTALITGGAGHMGQAAAQALLELGASVVVLDQAGSAQAAAEVLSAQFPKTAVRAISCDLHDEGAARQAVRASGGLDILVHCAAYVGTTDAPGWAVPFAQQTAEAWDAAMRVNVTSAFVLTQAAHLALAASGRGSVVLLSSIYGVIGPDLRLYEGTTMANPAAYGASKGGLLQLMRYLATMLAPAVRVNAISPGGIRRDQPREFQQRYAERTPLKRMATEEDLKGAIAYLCSDLSAYVTGHNLIVDGGWTAW